MMMISLRNPSTGEPNHPESLFYLIPKDILFIIARYIASWLITLIENIIQYNDHCSDSYKTMIHEYYEGPNAKVIMD